MLTLLTIKKPSLEKEFEDYHPDQAVCLIDVYNLSKRPTTGLVIGIYSATPDYIKLVDHGVVMTIPWGAVSLETVATLVKHQGTAFENTDVDFTLTPTGIACRNSIHNLTVAQHKILEKLLKNKDFTQLWDVSKSGNSLRVLVHQLRNILRSVGSKTQIVARRGWQQYKLDTSFCGVKSTVPTTETETGTEK